MSFGNFLRNARKQSGFRYQIQLSEATGVSQASISRIENDDQFPDPTTLKLFAKPLGYTHEELLKIAGYLNEQQEVLDELTELRVENADLKTQNAALKEVIKNLVKGW